MHQVLLLDVDLEVNVGAEALPAVKTQEGSLASVGDQMVLETDGNLEWCVTLRADLVLGTGFISVHQMTQSMEHDLISPTKPRINQSELIIHRY